MGIKVVYNSCYGGFGISLACANRMKELGALLDDTYWDAGDGEHYVTLDCDYPRHCPFLVQAVEELGNESASGMCSDVRIREIKGDRYIIKEYDGLERVVEPDDIKWCVVQQNTN